MVDEEHDDPIDVTPLMNGAHGQGRRRLLSQFLGLRETDRGINLPFPDGEIEMTWSLEECEHFMQVYLSNERADSRYQNRRKWNYSIWRFVMELYAEGLTHVDIAAKVSEEFPAYQVEDGACSKYTIKTIIGYRQWRIAKRMRFLLAKEKAEIMLSRRRNAASKAEESELEIVDQLRQELKACVAVLQELSPVEPEYNKTVSSIKNLKEIISSISGLDSIRKIEIFKEEQNIRKDMTAIDNSKRIEDPKTMKPTIISE